MKRWKTIYEDLQLLKVKERKFLFQQFKDSHANWSESTLFALSNVVVKMERQVDVCKNYNIRKQALNRSVRHYRNFIVKIKYAN